MDDFTRKQEKAIRKQVSLGIMDAWKDQKGDIIRMCMTREECLSIHQGRRTSKELNGNGNNTTTAQLNKQKFKFWGKMVGLITAVTILISTVTGIVIAINLG